MKKFIAVLLAVLMMAALFTGCGKKADAEKTDWEYIKDKGSLVIGITDYEPMNYYDADGKLIGFDTEYAEAVCAKLGIKAEFIEIDWDLKEMELDSKNVDALWNGVTYTEERDENMDFSDPYVYNGIVIVIRAEDAEKYKTLEDLAGAVIASEAGSSGEECVLADEGLSQNYVAVTGLADALREVASYTADAAVVDSTMAEKVVGTGAYENLVILEGITLSEEVIAIGFRTGSDMVAKVNEITDELAKDGTMDALAEKYSINFIND